MKKLLIVFMLTGCAVGMPRPVGTALWTHTAVCGVVASGYDGNGNLEDGAEMIYLSYENKTFGLAEFEAGENGAFKTLTLELGSGDVVKLNLEEVKALNLEPCTALGYAVSH